MSNSQPIVVALGTRPEIIKLAPVVAALGERAEIVHTGQHYDRDLSAVFFEQFRLPEPRAQLSIGNLTRVEQIGATGRGLSSYLREQPARAVVVQGDTNTTLGAALGAADAGTPVVHVEAGLRSFDSRMPEEHNRILTDRLSALCGAPTEVSVANLEAEGIATGRIALTGNTIVEALEALIPADRGAILDRWEVDPAGFVLSTFHRPENVDDPVNLAKIMHELSDLPTPVLLPVHPRTAARLEAEGITPGPGVRLVEPIGYVEFVSLAAESALLISDSGGVQEEVSVLKRPVIVVRRSTERPEVIGTFAVRVEPGPEIGRQARAWLADVPALHDRLAEIPGPYGEGDAAARIVAAIEERL
jgi:UDP-N-acetylglucosamine 2-epimerase (non-hydrolysing)